MRVVFGKVALLPLVLLWSGLVSIAVAAPATPLPVRQLTVIGDSLSDQGNLFAATSVIGPPIGQPAIPDAKHYFEGRFSNGEIYAGVLAHKLGFTLRPSLKGGSNFAFGGARTDYNRVEAPRGPYARGAYPWSLNAQREAFLGQTTKKRADPTGLYIVFSGSNDVGDILALGRDPATTIATAVEGIANVVLAYKAAGARTVLVPNVPNLGVVPSITRFGPQVAALASLLSSQFNAALEAKLASIAGIHIVRFDTFTFLTRIIVDPGQYGFSNATQPCYSGFVDPNPGAIECTDPDSHVFWDIEHPTRKLHALLAEQLFESVLHCESVARRGEPAPDTPGSLARCMIHPHRQ